MASFFRSSFPPIDSGLLGDEWKDQATGTFKGEIKVVADSLFTAPFRSLHFPGARANLLAENLLAVHLCSRSSSTNSGIPLIYGVRKPEFSTFPIASHCRLKSV